MPYTDKERLSFLLGRINAFNPLDVGILIPNGVQIVRISTRADIDHAISIERAAKRKTRREK